jgi:hypothetical protein
MPDENKGNGGFAIIGILLAITLICIVAMIFFERYFLTKKNEKVVGRIILLCILINVLILVFLILTFGKIQFTPGPKGPKGLRGRRGHQGKMQGLNQCEKQGKTLGELKYETEKGNQIKIQTPSLEVS